MIFSRRPLLPLAGATSKLKEEEEKEKEEETCNSCDPMWVARLHGRWCFSLQPPSLLRAPL